MKVMVIGGGGREHAIAWRIAQSPRVEQVFVAPGNGGTALEPRLQNIALSSNEELVKFAQEQDIALTVVGPEAPLAAGVVDAFRANGLKIFGPSQAAAQLESSKDYAKAFMVRHQIPTAAYATFTDAEQAHAYVEQQGAPIVVKADGLAAGKGVVVAETLEQAHQAIDDMIGGGKLGSAGARVVIEGFLRGEEASFIVMVDGKNVLPLASSQDHKRQLDNDQGPNTGGMGAYSPAPIVTDALHQRIMDEVIYPTVQGMAADGIEYTGYLYAGLMIDEGEDATRPIKVLEFNCRMGDPETQPIMMRLKSSLVELVEAGIAGNLPAEAEWDERKTVGIVLASKGYPETSSKDDVISGLNTEMNDAKVFHAGTALNANGDVVTAGGRVLCVTALGNTIGEAQAKALELCQKVTFDGVQYRQDIGYRAIARENA